MNERPSPIIQHLQQLQLHWPCQDNTFQWQMKVVNLVVHKEVEGFDVSVAKGGSERVESS